MGYYQKHLFICLNQREGGKKCCQDGGADAMQAYAKQRIKALKLDGRGGIRINGATCLGRCKQGPVLVIYPDNVWYTYHTQADIDEIITRHLQQGEPVTRLLLEDVISAAPR